MDIEITPTNHHIVLHTRHVIITIVLDRNTVVYSCYMYIYSYIYKKNNHLQYSLPVGQLDEYDYFSHDPFSKYAESNKHVGRYICLRNNNIKMIIRFNRHR